MDPELEGAAPTGAADPSILDDSAVPAAPATAPHTLAPSPAAPAAAAGTAVEPAAAAAPIDPSAFALNEDGSARDPSAFQAALLADTARVAELRESFPEQLAVIQAGDTQALQELLRAAVKAERARLERAASRWPERSIDAQRASAPVPRDTVHVYKVLAQAGLEYGPAFRLLRNVHVPLSST